MRRGTNVSYTLDQKELIEFIHDVKHFKNLSEDALMDYVNNYGRLATYNGKTEYYYNPVYAVNDLFRRHGMTCPICDTHYTGLNSEECRIPRELRITFLPEFPVISGGYEIFAPVMCRKCWEEYKRYRSQWYIKKEIVHYEDKMKLPIKFLGLMARRVGRGKSFHREKGIERIKQKRD